jgi:hypothetical protein
LHAAAFRRRYTGYVTYLSSQLIAEKKCTGPNGGRAYKIEH